LGFAFIFILAVNITTRGEQQFVYLANTLLHGRLDLIDLPSTADFAFFANRYYWPLGPFPAIILIPFVTFLKLQMLQGYLQFALTIINFLLVLNISQKLGLKSKQSWLISLFFIFGSIYTPLAAIAFSWYYAQIVATTLLLLAIFEFLTKKRYLLIGLALGCAILTRASLITSIIFFLYFLFKKPINLKNVFAFLTPIALSICVIAIYNYSRFGSPFESGYKYQLIPPEAELRRNEGIFSLQHVPANFYYMFIKGPDPILKDESHILKFPYMRFDYYGMSILLLSPILLLIPLASFRNKTVLIAIITILLTMIPILTYYGIGYRQVGYRYALDFYPFLLFPLISAVKKVSYKVLSTLVLLGVGITWFFLIERLSGF